jgi:very-short-patch-repair endonuclease
LRSSGLEVLRFENKEIEEKIEVVIDKIKDYIQLQIH